MRMIGHTWALSSFQLSWTRCKLACLKETRMSERAGRSGAYVLGIYELATHPVRCNLAFLLLSKPNSSADADATVKGLLLHSGLQSWARWSM